MSQKFYKAGINCNEKLSVCRYVIEEVYVKIFPRKKVMGKKRSRISQFYRFFDSFSISHTVWPIPFFSRIHAVLNFSSMSYSLSSSIDLCIFMSIGRYNFLAILMKHPNWKSLDGSFFRSKKLYDFSHEKT